MVKPHYSVIIPTHNEAKSLLFLLPELGKAIPPSTEIIVVDDASTDSTQAVLQKFSSKRVSGLHLTKRSGKWAALRAGFAIAQAPVLITLDADLQDDPSQLPVLLSAFSKGRFAIVSGWREPRMDPFYKCAFSNLGNVFISLVTRHQFHDINAPFKIYQRAVLEELPWHGNLLRFSLLLAFKMGYSVTEIPINHRPRKFGKSKFGPKKYFRILYDLLLIQLFFTGSNKLKKSGLEK